MSFVIFYAGAWLAGLIAAFVTGSIRRGVRPAAWTFLLWQLVVSAGLGTLYAASGHLIAADRVAKSIGWPTGSPFQTELGWAVLAMGVLGIMCFWIRDRFWLAPIVALTIFLGAAAGLHIQQMVTLGNFSPGNALTTVPDLLGPATLWVLWFLARAWHGEPAKAASPTA